MFDAAYPTDEYSFDDATLLALEELAIYDDTDERTYLSARDWLTQNDNE